MKYISSDTNVWLDFAVIDRLDLPFKLPYTYLMDHDAIDDELLSPPDLGKRLISMGLTRTELTEEEFFLAEELVNKYAKPSLYDCIALAIAKVRGITLLTGDGPLRKAAQEEGVKVMGTIGVLDKLYEGHYIDVEEFDDCINELIRNNGGKVRLPEKELLSRKNQAKYRANECKNS